MPSLRAHAAKPYAFGLLAWTGVGVFFFSQDLTRKLVFGDSNPWWHLLVSWIAGVYVFALLTPLILLLGRRFPIDRPRWVRGVTLHVSFAVALALVQLTVDSALLSAARVMPPGLDQSFPSVFKILFVIGLHGNILTYWTVIGLQYAFRHYRQLEQRKQDALRLEVRAAELSSQLVRAELSALKMQLQPHFLFNTLNAIMVLVRQGRPVEAEDTLDKLSDLLRSALDDVHVQEVTLLRELEFARLYLAIEHVRFRDRLTVEFDAEGEVLDAAVPQMSLQPVIENAVRHGIEARSASGRIRIQASHVGATLELSVTDDGPGLGTQSAPGGTGVGLANTRSRLMHLYGESARLTIANAEPRGTRVTMSIPFHLAVEPSRAQSRWEYADLGASS